MSAVRSVRSVPRRMPPASSRSHPLWLRRITFAFALLFAWSFVFAAPVAALAQQPAAHPKPRPLSDHVGPAWRPIDYHTRPAVSAAALKRPQPLPTLLDE